MPRCLLRQLLASRLPESKAQAAEAYSERVVMVPHQTVARKQVMPRPCMAKHILRGTPPIDTFSLAYMPGKDTFTVRSTLYTGRTEFD